MKRRPPLARISITLPQPELGSADQLAARLDRSRSWVISEAIRRWAGVGPDSGEPARTSGTDPSNPSAPAPPRLIEPSAALKLSPAGRLQMAQELTAQFRRAHPRPARMQIIAFGSEKDFLDWRETL